MTGSLKKIGVCAPASPTLEIGALPAILQRLTGLGLEVVASQHIARRTSYLAGSDAERIADLHDLFLNPEVEAIFALRGGYGSCRLLRSLDYKLIQTHPKPFIGYSDITAPLNALFSQIGLVTYHGPNAGQAFQGEAPTRSLLNALSPNPAPLLIGPESGFTLPVETLVPGQASGRLLGGNFTCLERLLGTPYQPDFRGALLFLEDISEKAYRIDGLFTHFRLAGVLDQIAGLVLGQFTHTDLEEVVRIQDCLQREALAIGVPCIGNAPIGHEIEQITVPMGRMATLDAGAKTLMLKD